MNLPIMAAAALIPLILGFIWYNPKVFGPAWMNATGLTDEKMKSGNMAVVFILTYVFSFFLAAAMNFIVIHQMGFYSSLMTEANRALLKDPNSDLSKYVADYAARFGSNFKTFKHGAFHGTIAGITIALPILAITAMFERKGFKYIAINAGYWILVFILMGGVICQFAK